MQKVRVLAYFERPNSASLDTGTLPKKDLPRVTDLGCNDFLEHITINAIEEKRTLLPVSLLLFS
jgi:hypothetical protein